MNECIVNDNTVKWHYTTTLIDKSKWKDDTRQNQDYMKL